MQPTDNLEPTTTLEEDKHTSSQRQVNLIWEFTQAAIAIAITIAKIYTAIKISESTSLDNAFFLIVGFYFGRTNHQRVGGVILGR